MHTVHKAILDIDEFSTSPRVFFVTNKVIHGNLRGGRGDRAAYFYST